MGAANNIGLRNKMAHKRQAAISVNNRPMMLLQYPSWRDLSNVKLQIKVNLNNLLTSLTPPSSRQLTSSSTSATIAAANTLLGALLRWAMPSQIKIQAEYTYANLVVRL